jgi:hypothetical protein
MTVDRGPGATRSLVCSLAVNEDMLLEFKKHQIEMCCQIPMQSRRLMNERSPTTQMD